MVKINSDDILVSFEWRNESMSLYFPLCVICLHLPCRVVLTDH